MSRPKVSIKIPKKQLVDENTRFFIDYTWWDESGRSLESYLQSNLGIDAAMGEEGQAIDLIDMETGEVQALSSFEYAMQSYFNQQDDDFMQKGSVVDSIFSVLLSTGNRPMRATEIAERIGRPADTVYRTVGGKQVFLGIRPYGD